MVPAPTWGLKCSWGGCERGKRPRSRSSGTATGFLIPPGKRIVHPQEKADLGSPRLILQFHFDQRREFDGDWLLLVLVKDLQGKKTDQPYRAELWASPMRVAGLFQESELCFVLETCTQVIGVYGLQVLT